MADLDESSLVSADPKCIDPRQQQMILHVPLSGGRKLVAAVEADRVCALVKGTSESGCNHGIWACLERRRTSDCGTSTLLFSCVLSRDTLFMGDALSH